MQYLALSLTFSFLCSFSITQAENQSGEFDLKPLEKWLKSQSSVQSATADFIQKRQLATLNREITTKGKLWIKYPDKFHWQMGEPAKARILRNGEDMQFINLRKKSTKSFKVNSSEGRRYAFMTSKFASDLNTFLEAFKVTKVWEKKGVHYTLFQPKKIALKKRVPYLALGIYREQNKLGLFEMHLEDKSVIRTTFTNYKTNVKVDEQVFELETK